MSSEHEIESHIQKNQQLIQEITIQIEALNRNINLLHDELQVSPEQLTTFIENKENFSEENWQNLIEQRKSLNEKLLKDLLNISNPKKRKDSLKSLNIQPHWLHVR